MSWQELPADILLMIFEKIAVKDLIKSSIVCKHWNSIAESNTLWKKIFNDQLEEGKEEEFHDMENIKNRIKKKISMNQGVNWNQRVKREEF